MTTILCSTSTGSLELVAVSVQYYQNQTATASALAATWQALGPPPAIVASRLTDDVTAYYLAVAELGCNSDLPDAQVAYFCLLDIGPFRNVTELLARQLTRLAQEAARNAAAPITDAVKNQVAALSSTASQVGSQVGCVLSVAIAQVQGFSYVLQATLDVPLKEIRKIEAKVDDYVNRTVLFVDETIGNGVAIMEQVKGFLRVANATFHKYVDPVFLTVKKLIGYTQDLGFLQPYLDPIVNFANQVLPYGESALSVLEMISGYIQTGLDQIHMVENVAESLRDFKGLVLSFINQLRDKFPWLGGKKPPALVGPTQISWCSNSLCIQPPAERSNDLYRSIVWAIKFIMFWDGATPPLIETETRQYNYLLPGLFTLRYRLRSSTYLALENNLPLAPKHTRLLVAYEYTGMSDDRSTGDSSIFVVMDGTSNVLRLYALQDEYGNWFTGSLSGVTKTRKLLWTTDDSWNAERGQRNNEIIAFTLNEILDPISDGIPKVPGTLRIAKDSSGRYLRIPVPVYASMLYYHLLSGTLYIGETVDPSSRISTDQISDPSRNGGWAVSYSMNADSIPIAWGAFASGNNLNSCNFAGRSCVPREKRIQIGLYARGLSFVEQLGKHYLAISYSSYKRGFPCRIEFHKANPSNSDITLTSYPYNKTAAAAGVPPPTLTHSVRVPVGAESLAYDEIEYLLIPFSSGFEANQDAVTKSGGDIEDTMYIMRLPILENQKFAITGNIVYIKLGGFYDLLPPTCLVPLSNSSNHDCVPVDTEAYPSHHLLSLLPPDQQIHAKMQLEARGRRDHRPHVRRAVHSMSYANEERGEHWVRLLADSPCADQPNCVKQWGDGSDPGETPPDGQDADTVDCLKGIKPLFDPYVKPLFERERTQVVVVVPVHWEIHLLGHLLASLGGELCLGNKSARIYLEPEGFLSLDVEAGLDVIFARAGFYFYAIALDTKLIPSVRLRLGDGSDFQVCALLDLELKPLYIEIGAWYQIFACVVWDECCCPICIPYPRPDFCPREDYPLYSWGLDPININLVTLCFGSRDNVYPTFGNVTALQIDAASLSIQWSGCRDNIAGISHHERCVGTRSGQYDILPCRNMGKAESVRERHIQLPASMPIYVTARCINNNGYATERTVSFDWDATAPAVLGFEFFRRLDAKWVEPWLTSPEWQLDWNEIGPGTGTWLNTTRLVAFRFRVDEPENSSNISEVVYAVADTKKSQMMNWTNVGNGDILRLKDSSKYIYINATNGGTLELTTGSYYISIRTTNNFGLQHVFYFPFQIDATAPLINAMEILPVATVPPLLFFPFDTFVSARFHCSDAESGMMHAWTRFTVFPTGGDIERDKIIQWKHTAPLNDAGYVDRDMWPFQGMNLSVAVYCINHARGVSAVESRPYLVDLTPPYCDEVISIDPRGIDGGYSYVFTSHLDRFIGNLFCIDPESGVVNIEISVGSYPGATDVIPWYPIPLNSTSILIDHFTPTDHAVYHLQLRATNAVGLVTVSYSQRVMYMTQGATCYPPMFEASVEGVLTAYSPFSDRLSADWAEGVWDMHTGIRNFQILLAPLEAIPQIMKALEEGSSPISTVFQNTTSVNVTVPLAAFIDVGLQRSTTFQNLALQHDADYAFILRTTNGASTVTYCVSSPVHIDMTPPLPGKVAMGNPMYSAVDDTYSVLADLDYQYQWYAFNLFPRWWNFTDPESPIIGYSLQAFDDLGIEMFPLTYFGNIAYAAIPLSMTHLHAYSVAVTAINAAGLTSTVQSGLILIDRTPPVVEWVVNGGSQQGEDAIYLLDPSKPLEVSFSIYDYESNIGRIIHCIGMPRKHGERERVVYGRLFEFRCLTL
jgi:hypothetical protein